MKKIWMIPIVLLVAACGRPQHSRDFVVTETYVHKYGVEVPADDWIVRGENGQVISNLSNGVRVNKNFAEGSLEGETTYSFPHSESIHKIEFYNHGVLVKELVNNSSGQPQREIRYHSPTHQTVIVWYDNGSPQSEEEYENGLLVNGEYFTPNHQIEARVDNREGTKIERDEFGQLLSSEVISGGIHVERTLYYPNQSPKEKIPYQNGLVEGEKRTFLPTGEPKSIENWHKDKQEGLTILYKNGEKYAEVQYENGVKHGTELRFRDGSTIAEEIQWMNGLRHGQSNTYIQDTVTNSWYFKDKPVSKATFDQLRGPSH